MASPPVFPAEEKVRIVLSTPRRGHADPRGSVRSSACPSGPGAAIKPAHGLVAGAGLWPSTGP